MFARQLKGCVKVSRWTRNREFQHRPIVGEQLSPITLPPPAQQRDEAVGAAVLDPVPVHVSQRLFAIRRWQQDEPGVVRLEYRLPAFLRVRLPVRSFMLGEPTLKSHAISTTSSPSLVESGERHTTDLKLASPNLQLGLIIQSAAMLSQLRQEIIDINGP